MHTTRFAPSPTGLLHLGHAYAALMAQAQSAGGRFLLRMEDLDTGRCRAAFAEAIEEDLAWLGLSWPRPVLQQSSRSAAYTSAIARLEAQELVYPCFCTRRQIEAEIAGAMQAPHDAGGPVYPGTCRDMSRQEWSARLLRGDPHVRRLHVSRASSLAGPLSFTEYGRGPQGEHGPIAVDPGLMGDIVLARRDAPASYHLAVVVDDAFQGVSLVTRGNDLFAATHVQRLLQALLALPTPGYAHHRLILDESGRKLSKRSGPVTLRDLRREGWTPPRLRERLGLA